MSEINQRLRVRVEGLCSLLSVPEFRCACACSVPFGVTVLSGRSHRSLVHMVAPIKTTNPTLQCSP